MENVDKDCNFIKEKILASAPDNWARIRKSAARLVAAQLLAELDGVPSNCGKLIYEQVMEVPAPRRVA